MLTPRTSARASLGMTWNTSPFLPLSRPVSTITWSPFFILAEDISEHLRGEADDLHVVPGPELARDRPEDARADRLALRVDQHGGVAVEADQRAVRPAHALGRAHHHRLHHLALLDSTARDRLLDGDDDGVADRGVAALGAAQHLDALQAACAGVIGHVEIGLHLDHKTSPRLIWPGLPA